MWNGVCPVCGATEVYGKAGGIMPGANGWALIVQPWRFGWRKRVILDSLICGKCGHVALQVPWRDMEELHTTFQKGGWTRLKGPNEVK